MPCAALDRADQAPDQPDLLPRRTAPSRHFEIVFLAIRKERRITAISAGNYKKLRHKHGHIAAISTDQDRRARPLMQIEHGGEAKQCVCVKLAGPVGVSNGRDNPGGAAVRVRPTVAARWHVGR